MKQTIYNRDTKSLMEEKPANSLIFLYNTLCGRLILKLITAKVFSQIFGFFARSRLSTLFIPRFIAKNQIAMADYIKEDYHSFDAFFTRKIKQEKRPITTDLPAVADSKLTVYPIEEKLLIKVKNSSYSLEELLKEQLKAEFNGGYCLIFRLAVNDYHHYIYVDKGNTVKEYSIAGILHTVNPIAFAHYRVFSENQREVTLLNTENYGDVYTIEVGALNVGKINNRHCQSFSKGEEKGYFSFGGSTIILLFEKDKIIIDKDIAEASACEIETAVRLGEKIGQKVN